MFQVKFVDFNVLYSLHQVLYHEPFKKYVIPFEFHVKQGFYWNDINQNKFYQQVLT